MDNTPYDRMKRKIIELGNNCMVMSLPIQWVKENSLKKGMELTVDKEDNKLVISPSDIKKKPAEIEVKLEGTRESAIRTVIVNAYRAGYDRIIAAYVGPKSKLSQVVSNQLLGFEMFDKASGIYSIESVSEPGYDNYEKIIEKNFFVVQEILKNIGGEIASYLQQVQKYDNFLKRCMSKNIINPKGRAFMWQFLSGLTEISRQAGHLNEYLDGKTKLSSKEKSVLSQILDMFSILQKAYLTKNADNLPNLHKVGPELVFARGEKMLREGNPVIIHYLLAIARQTYILTSPLTGAIQMEKLNK